MPVISKENLQLFHKTKLICRAVDHKRRQQMLDVIYDKGEITVTQLYIKLRISQSEASQQLAVLRKAGFVKTRRNGRDIFYSVDSDNISNYISRFNGINKSYQILTPLI